MHVRVKVSGRTMAGNSQKRWKPKKYVTKQVHLKCSLLFFFPRKVALALTQTHLPLSDLLVPDPKLPIGGEVLTEEDHHQLGEVAPKDADLSQPHLLSHYRT